MEINWFVVVAVVAVVAGGTAFLLYRESKKKLILVWHKNQRVPATVCGDKKFGKGKYKIIVCKDPNIQLAKYGKRKAMIYHHP